jgi:osmotically-inducible protein OsmY
MKRAVWVIALLLLAGGGAFYFFSDRGGSLWNLMQRREDSVIVENVKSAFGLSKRLSAYEIKVAARDGVVTLTGQVPSEIEKELAASVAKDTRGVKQVDNQIQIEPGLKPAEESIRESARVADLEIRADLQERLAASPELKGKEIQLSVQDRVVTLSGQVETLQQRMGAEQLARAVSNVASVVNNLTVTHPDAALTEVPGVTESEARDQELAQQVSFALFKERDNFASVGAIKVEARNGNVTLSGSVVSRAERALAERIAREVKGVNRINNTLTVAPAKGLVSAQPLSQ